MRGYTPSIAAQSGSSKFEETDMPKLPPVKMSECDEITYCFYCSHAIYTDRYYDELSGWEWNGTCPSCCRDALGRDRLSPDELADGELVGTLRSIATQWRAGSKGHSDGVVLIWQGTVYGWKNCLRDAAHEQPGAYAVDESGHVFIAKGGNEYDGAKAWVAVATN
ncbi:hypothetical protein PA6566_06719 [Pseudomonas aeruginosa]|nr:hypothetical protein [Pseudomonas aeruginosa]CRR85092.1 hypothetical protein PAERUG_P54_2_London_24_VIM_2_04_13_02682 [Pseudomonas aeruginosa]CRX03897.1 hypothetical protein PAERUG_P54_1_London_24_VIM_2_04_13_01930 [Pseudomonas aeruginosa]SCZ06674.1 Uncharacterised protein [Acinetobacter baumannii]